jgi:hypothetical protein
MADEPAPDFITAFMEALAEGIATCAALAGERPVTALGGVDVTDELLKNPERGLERLEWAMVEMREQVASGQATGGIPTTDEDIARVQRLRTLVATGSSDVPTLASDCIAWLQGSKWRERL